MQLDRIQSFRYDRKKNQQQSRTDITNESIKQSQFELYESENYQMFTYINNLITKLSIEKERLSNSSNNIKIQFQNKYHHYIMST